MKHVALFALLTLVPSFVAGSEYKPMSGQYAISGPTLINAPAGEKQDRLVLFLEGDAARETFLGIAASATAQVCAPEGTVTKSVGGVSCTFDAKDDSYLCWIGLILDSGDAVKLDVPC